LSPDYNVIRSPKATTQVVGVPLSVAINEKHNLGILKGISTVSEMAVGINNKTNY
jgi:alanine racemase